MADPSGQAAAGCHSLPVRVYWEDTDASGIVYHASYLRFAERARTEFLRSVGIEQSGLLAETGVAITVRRCEIDFRAPARLDDALAVETRITDIAGASLRAEQIIRRAGAVLVRMLVQLACINQAGRATRMPPSVRAAFSAFAIFQSPPGPAETEPAGTDPAATASAATDSPAGAVPSAPLASSET